MSSEDSYLKIGGGDQRRIAGLIKSHARHLAHKIERKGHHDADMQDEMERFEDYADWIENCNFGITVLASSPPREKSRKK